MHWPRKTFLWSGSILLLTLTAKSFYTAQAKAAGASLPWGWMVLVVVGFIGGQVAQDCYNPKSWIRLNLDALRAGLFTHASCWWDQPPNDPRRREAYSTLIVARDLRDAELRVWGYISGNLAPKLIESRTGLRLVKGAELKVVLATVSILPSGLAPRFGDLSSPHTLNPTEPKLVVIEMIEGWRRQTEAVELYIHEPGGQGVIRPITERASPFRWPEFKARP